MIIKCDKCGSENKVHFRESMEYICDECIKDLHNQKEVIKNNGV